jgi:putative NIF3 family GTP cyclohydrolase 1 type 2
LSGYDHGCLLPGRTYRGIEVAAERGTLLIASSHHHHIVLKLKMLKRILSREYTCLAMKGCAHYA